MIGTRVRNVSPEEGLAAIGFYAPANDFGVYDMRWADRGSNVMAKGQDGFTPLGPLAPATSVVSRRARPAHARQRRGRAGGHAPRT